VRMAGWEGGPCACVARVHPRRRKGHLSWTAATSMTCRGRWSASSVTCRALSPLAHCSLAFTIVRRRGVGGGGRGARVVSGFGRRAVPLCCCGQPPLVVDLSFKGKAQSSRHERFPVATTIAEIKAHLAVTRYACTEGGRYWSRLLEALLLAIRSPPFRTTAGPPAACASRLVNMGACLLEARQRRPYS
jgi:hypothetical protein